MRKVMSLVNFKDRSYGAELTMRRKDCKENRDGIPERHAASSMIEPASLQATAWQCQGECGEQGSEAHAACKNRTVRLVMLGYLLWQSRTVQQMKWARALIKLIERY